MKIAVDAGHGSATAGKRSPSGYREHWANVRVASYFARAMARCGVPYIKVGWNDDNSADDPDIAVTARQREIRAAGCDYSISFHFNAFGDGSSYNSAQGVECLISNKAPADSKRMADRVLKYLVRGTGQINRGVKVASLALCNCSVMGTRASIIVECAFMTNLYEEMLMKSDSFCLECAEEAAQGFCEYVGIRFVPISAEDQGYLIYTVAKGDTLYSIGKRFGIPWQRIADINGIAAPYIIYPGQKLKI